MSLIKKLTRILLTNVVVLAGAAGWAWAETRQEITVAYFLEWPLPFQFAKVNGIYEEKLGIKINWRAFDTGTAMSAAMVSGDVQIAISHGLPPFVVAVSAGQDLQIADIAVSYSKNDNCVVKASLEITKDNAKALEGKRVAVPVGTAAHYGFLRQMEHFGVDVSKLRVVDMAPPDAAAAFAQGSLDMACGWGGSLRKMREHGNVLLTGKEKEELGIRAFDVTSVTAAYMAENPEQLARFLRVTADMNERFLKEAKEMIPVIARDAGMSLAAAKETLAAFQFPSIDAQLSKDWFGGGLQAHTKAVAEFFVATGNMPSALSDYAGAINSEPLSAAKQIKTD